MGRMLRGRSWTGIRDWKRGEEWLFLKQKMKTKKSNEGPTVIYAAVIASNHLLRTAWPWRDRVEVWLLQDFHHVSRGRHYTPGHSPWLYSSRGRLSYIPQRRS